MDTASRWALSTLAVLVALGFFSILGVLVTHSLDAFRHSGASLVTGGVWDPVSGVYGAWPFIFGTLFSSGIAISLAIPVGFAVALFLTELAPTWLRTPTGVLVELLAGVPSIVFGIWGVAVLAPLVARNVYPWTKAHLSLFPLFGGASPYGNFLLAGLVLAIMVLPTITAIARDALLAVPRLEREAAYALGATRWEVARTALRSAKTGLFAASTLGLGRALGETMAVYFVIGGGTQALPHLFDAGNSIASTLALQINEATDPTHVSALIALGLILFVLTLLVNLGARLAIERPWRKHA